MDDFALDHRAPRRRTAHQRQGRADRRAANVAKISGGAQLLAVDHEHVGIACVADVRGAIDHHIQNGFVVGDRIADGAQDVGDRSLPFERFPGLVEKPRVLDRDHRLVGEGLDQRQLLVG